MATTFSAFQGLGISESTRGSSKVTEDQIQAVLYRELLERVAKKLEVFLMMNLEPRVSANHFNEKYKKR